MCSRQTISGTVGSKLQLRADQMKLMQENVTWMEKAGWRIDIS